MELPLREAWWITTYDAQEVELMEINATQSMYSASPVQWTSPVTKTAVSENAAAAKAPLSESELEGLPKLLGWFSVQLLMAQPLRCA